MLAALQEASEVRSKHYAESAHVNHVIRAICYVVFKKVQLRLQA